MTTLKNNPLKDIVFEDINDDFCYGHYSDFKVIMMKKNGYINATKMCQYISEHIHIKKQYVDWKRTENAIEMIDKLGSNTGYPVTELSKTIRDGNNQTLCGTYIHPDLILHVASWCSAEFAIKVSRIANKYINKEKKDVKTIENMTQEELCDEQQTLNEQSQKISIEQQKRWGDIEKNIVKEKKVNKKKVKQELIPVDFNDDSKDDENNAPIEFEENDELLDEETKNKILIDFNDDSNDDVSLKTEEEDEDGEKPFKYDEKGTKKMFSEALKDF
jgi:predicted Holliday junction resolvase-like endonuclease